MRLTTQRVFDSSPFNQSMNSIHVVVMRSISRMISLSSLAITFMFFFTACYEDTVSVGDGEDADQAVDDLSVDWPSTDEAVPEAPSDPPDLPDSIDEEVSDLNDSVDVLNEYNGCITDSECEEDEFCEFVEGVCGPGDHGGKCVQVPDSETCYSPETDMVCGCGGHNFLNDCFRRAERISRHHVGACNDLHCNCDGDCLVPPCDPSDVGNCCLPHEHPPCEGDCPDCPFPSDDIYLTGASLTCRTRACIVYYGTGFCTRPCGESAENPECPDSFSCTDISDRPPAITYCVADILL